LERLLLDRQQPIFASKTHNFHSFEGAERVQLAAFINLKKFVFHGRSGADFYGTKRPMIDPQLKTAGR
jgi:hypothetical protein